MEDDFQYYYIDQDIKQSRPWTIFYGTHSEDYENSGNIYFPRNFATPTSSRLQSLQSAGLLANNGALYFLPIPLFWRKGGSAATDMGPLILFLLTKMALAKVPHPYQEAEDFSPEDAEDAGTISEGKVVPKEKVKSC